MWWEPRLSEGTGVHIQRVLMPVTGTESWTVIGDDGAVVAPVERYLAYLSAHGALAEHGAGLRGQPAAVA